MPWKVQIACHFLNWSNSLPDDCVLVPCAYFASPGILSRCIELDNMLTFFDCDLPEEMNERILYFLSDRPRQIKSRFFLNSADILSLCVASKKLRVAALKIYRSLTTLHWKHIDEYKCDLIPTPNGHIVPDPEVLPALLLAIGDNLRQLHIYDTRLGDGREWMKALTTKARPTSELVLGSVFHCFPLSDVLTTCATLKKLTLELIGNDQQRHLDSMADHAPQLISLTLERVNPHCRFSHIRDRLQSLEELSHTISLCPCSTGNLYDGLAHALKSLRKLALGYLDPDHLISALHLFQAIGNRLLELSLKTQHKANDDEWGLYSNAVLTELGNMSSLLVRIAVHNYTKRLG